MTAKEQKIKEAWIEAVGDEVYALMADKILSDGYISEYNIENPHQYQSLLSEERRGGWEYFIPESILRINTNNGWTRCDERLPEEAGHCDCFYEGEVYFDCFYYWTEGEFTNSEGFPLYPTHWRPKTEYPLPIY